MQKFIWFTSFLVLGKLYAQGTDYVSAERIIRCLATEETYFDKNKNQNAEQRVNRRLLGYFSKSDLIPVQRPIVSKTCQSQLGNRSEKLLELLMLKGKKAFDIPGPLRAAQSAKLSIQKQTALDFIDTLPSFLAEYMKFIELESTPIGCFRRVIPEIEDFHTKMFYLRRKNQTRSILPSEKIIRKIFQLARAPERLARECKRLVAPV